ncbi:uncharacterized protein [Panulirus ornatus]|uniref:uncharacterized protein n=1 Tax=Panulirus ornatus TaxID=150431 RepID=UPI003A881F18
MVASELDRRCTGFPTNHSGQLGRCPPPVIVKVHLKKHLRDNPALAAVVEEAERTRLAQLHKKRKSIPPKLSELHQKQVSSPRLVRLHQERQGSSPKLARLQHERQGSSSKLARLQHETQGSSHKLSRLQHERQGISHKLARLQHERQGSSPMRHQQCSLLRVAWGQEKQGSSPMFAWLYKEKKGSSPKLTWRHEESQEARPRKQPVSASCSPHSFGRDYTHDSRSDSTRRQRLSSTSCPTAQNFCKPSLSGTHSHQEPCPAAGEEQHRRITSRRRWRELLQRAVRAFRMVLVPLCRDKKVAKSSDSLVDRF